MSRLGQVIQQLFRKESESAVRVSPGTIEALNSQGEHLVSVDGSVVAARSVTDENIRIGDIVNVLFAGTHVLILGGKK